MDRPPLEVADLVRAETKRLAIVDPLRRYASTVSLCECAILAPEVMPSLGYGEVHSR